MKKNFSTIVIILIQLKLEITKKVAYDFSLVKIDVVLYQSLRQKGLEWTIDVAGVKFATYRRFEQTGEISLRGLLQIGFALNALSDFDALFMQQQYQSIDDVLNEQKFNRKRGKKNE